MLFAAVGVLPPVAGAIAQEAIDLAAILNALRMAVPPHRLSDFEPSPVAERALSVRADAVA